MPNSPLPDTPLLAAAFGRKVEAARKARGLTQDELWRRSDMSRSNLQNILYARHYVPGDEEEPSQPKLETIFKLSVALEVDIGYLVDIRRAVEPVPPPSSEG